MKKTISQFGQSTFNGKRALVRVDFNVPQHEDRTVADDSRIRAALPTIQFLRDEGAKVVLMSHLGRPKGKPNEKYSLKPVAEKLAELLSDKDKVDVVFAEDCVGEKAEKAVAALNPGDVCLLENVRFHEEEEKNDPVFSRQLAKLGDIYVNDAFGSAHRAHASTEGVTRELRPALAGFLMEREVNMLSQTLNNPTKPFATIIGGAKVSSKIGVLENLLQRVDVIVVGGAMAFTFLKAQGLNVGKSLVEDDRVEYCKELLNKAKSKGVKIILPKDVVCAAEIKEGAAQKTVSVDKIPADQMGLDVGPETMKEIEAELSKCKSILWNGPLGVFETKGFEKGTFELVDILVRLTAGGVKTVVGGGDSVAALAAKNVKDEALTHVSTGGGASLEFIEGIELPGVSCLDEVEAAASKA